MKKQKRIILVSLVSLLTGNCFRGVFPRNGPRSARNRDRQTASPTMARSSTSGGLGTDISSNGFPITVAPWIDLYGTDQSSSGDWNFDENVEGGKQQLRIHVEGTLTKGRLYHRLTTKTIFVPASARDKTTILYSETISIAAFKGIQKQP